MTDYIESISYAKLREFNRTRIDLPIRKYVLINNLLRLPKVKAETLLEQHWFENCLDQLEEEEEGKEENMMYRPTFIICTPQTIS
ncbi:hypothetical protein BDB01DRAFT_785947 [Pilobolus umbonatus]|nr:hypothetical protein BDB01DRAFT_785947 [Pilobolus umbonatus]